MSIELKLISTPDLQILTLGLKYSKFRFQPLKSIVISKLDSGVNLFDVNELLELNTIYVQLLESRKVDSLR